MPYRSLRTLGAKIVDDLDVLTASYDYPAEHWIHLRSTNPIESTFATVRLRTRVTKGPGSRAAGVAMASSSSSPPRPTGARSTHPPGRPGPRRREVRERQNSSNDPTNQEVISKPRDQGGHEAGRHVGQREPSGSGSAA
jgi:hypothetical protein